MSKTVRILTFKKLMLNKYNVVFNIPKKQVLASLVLGENSSVRAYSSCFMHPIVARMRLSIFLEMFSYFIHFCPNFQVFCPFLSFFRPFYSDRTHALTFQNRPWMYDIFGFKCKTLFPIFLFLPSLFLENPFSYENPT